MNKVILIGRLTKAPEVRYSQSNEPLAICKYTLAVNRKFKKDGEPEADFINCTTFGKQAEFCEKYFKKGMMIAVTGRIQIRAWEDKNKQKRLSTDIMVEEQEFTESKSSFEKKNKNNKVSDLPEGFNVDEFEEVEDDDLPF